MKTFDMRFCLVGATTFVVVLAIGGVFFGWLVHETAHTLGCIAFGLEYSWSLRRVVYVTSPTPLVNLVVRLAGGAGEALSSLGFFWFARNRLMMLKEEIVWQRTFGCPRSVKVSIFFGLELALLTTVFHGFIMGIWEGFFFESYVQIHGITMIWGIITLLCGVTSLLILYRMQSKFLRQTC
jgi:hypothetical protein